MISLQAMWLASILLFRDPCKFVEWMRPVWKFSDNMKYQQQIERWKLFRETIRNTRVVLYWDNGIWIDKRIIPRSGDAPSK